MAKQNIAVLIIAAGYSSRMGDFKPLLPLGKMSALERLIETYQAHGIGHIYVVVGHRKDELIDVLKGYKVHIVYNEDYDQGMFSSIQKGLRVMDERIEAFYMNPVDIPLIKLQSLALLYEAYEHEKKGVIYPTFLGRKGHPPLIDMKYKANILASDGKGGLKKVLEAFCDDALHVKVYDQSVLMDMDTKEDYEVLKAYEALHAPSDEECYALMDFYGVEERIIKHCQAVKSMVRILLHEVSRSGIYFDAPTLLAAALLHDIARKEKNHAFVGAQKLRAMGYDAIAKLIETHMDIDVDTHAPLNANEILFLADKLVNEDEVCGVKKRFAKALQKCEGNALACDNIQKRLSAVKAIIAKIQILTCKDFPYG
ncbi:MAG: NTP transferase domain-containing protein [Campylobacterales bacterium]|nr:NTP transferase domain-containing protein [Campylobacterales bacterium]MBN2832895.1 NTP transferase domain-containing protein [Campylobacterales bacterium]